MSWTVRYDQRERGVFDVRRFKDDGSHQECVIRHVHNDGERPKWVAETKAGVKFAEFFAFQGMAGSALNQLTQEVPRGWEWPEGSGEDRQGGSGQPAGAGTDGDAAAGRLGPVVVRRNRRRRSAERAQV